MESSTSSSANWSTSSSGSTTPRYDGLSVQRYKNQIKYGAKADRPRSRRCGVHQRGAAHRPVPDARNVQLGDQELPLLSTGARLEVRVRTALQRPRSISSARGRLPTVSGVREPIMLRDPEFGPVRLRAFGSFAIARQRPRPPSSSKVAAPRPFTVDEIGEQLRDMVVSRFADVLARAGSHTGPGQHYDELGKFITTRIEPDSTSSG